MSGVVDIYGKWKIIYDYLEKGDGIRNGSIHAISSEMWEHMYITV
jgi:hypothetical protein